jgi:hypothetical protein
MTAATTVSADPSFGIGISYVFGAGFAASAKVFSDDEDQKGALSLGYDYIFETRSGRPNIGIAYLENDMFIDLNLGMNLATKGTDFGVGIGGVCCMEDAAPSAAVAPGGGGNGNGGNGNGGNGNGNVGN